MTFTEETGIEVNYTEAIQDNADFFGTIRQDLQAEIRPGGTSFHRRWVIERMARLGYLEELDQASCRLAANCADYAKGLWFDPENKHSVYWQGHHRHRIRP